MRIELFYKGQKFDIYVIVTNDGERPAIDFLAQLKQANTTSHKTIINVLLRHAEHGPILNEEKSRPIKGKKYDGLYEFKSKQGARLLYFYLKGKITVLTSGFQKGAPANIEYKKARTMRDQIMKEGNNGSKF
jgi:hypothetical protein